MKYYAYYRVSTQSQAEQNGIEMQKNVVAKYCEDKNIHLSGEFQDLGISGTIVEREGITELLSVLEKGDFIIVQNTSRLWREYYATAIIKKAIEQIGADIISIEQPQYNISFKDPNEFLINGFMELLDQWDKLTISMKLAKGRKARAKTGNKPCGTAPYGYRWDGNDIVVDFNNNLVVKDIFDMCLEFNGNMSKIRRACIEKGYKTATGKDFSVQAIKNILHNDFYIGVVTYAGKKIAGQHEAIIENGLFDKVEKLMMKRED